MKKILFALFITVLLLCNRASATVKLIALTDPGNPVVTLQWNMVNYPGNTAYTLFKSPDGVTWSVAAANPIFRRYTSATILAYKDRFSDEEKLFYRVKVYDANENIVEVSNTAVVDNPKSFREEDASGNRENSYKERTPTTTYGALWQIAPNPVSDMLNLYYRGGEIIKGVINITILDASGKTVLKFRAASKNKQLHIPVDNLHTGTYFIKMNVLNEIQLNSKFIKQ